MSEKPKLKLIDCKKLERERLKKEWQHNYDFQSFLNLPVARQEELNNEYLKENPIHFDCCYLVNCFKECKTCEFYHIYYKKPGD